MVRRKTTPTPRQRRSRSQPQSPLRTKSQNQSQSIDGQRSTQKRRAKTRELRIANKSFKVHMNTIRSIKVLQATTFCCIPKLPFCRLVREIIQDVSGVSDMRIQIEALEALQESTELYLTSLFEDSNVAATHAKRITVQPIDMKLIIRLRRNEL